MSDRNMNPFFCFSVLCIFYLVRIVWVVYRYIGASWFHYFIGVKKAWDVENGKRKCDCINKHIKCNWTEHPTEKADFIRVNKKARSDSMSKVSKRQTETQKYK